MLGVLSILGGETRFNEYIDMLNKSDSGIISFQMEGTQENQYTTQELFDYFNIDRNSEYATSGQILAGILIMKKDINGSVVPKTWLKALSDNALLFTDHYNGSQKPPFIDNRHEQSVLSVIRKLYGSVVLSDETFSNHLVIQNQ